MRCLSSLPHGIRESIACVSTELNSGVAVGQVADGPEARSGASRQLPNPVDGTGLSSEISIYPEAESGSSCRCNAPATDKGWQVTADVRGPAWALEGLGVRSGRPVSAGERRSTWTATASPPHRADHEAQGRRNDEIPASNMTRPVIRERFGTIS